MYRKEVLHGIKSFTKPLQLLCCWEVSPLYFQGSSPSRSPQNQRISKTSGFPCHRDLPTKNVKNKTRKSITVIFWEKRWAWQKHLENLLGPHYVCKKAVVFAYYPLFGLPAAEKQGDIVGAFWVDFFSRISFGVNNTTIHGFFIHLT